MVEKHCSKCKINKNVELDDNYCSSCGQVFIDELPVNLPKYELVCEICDSGLSVSEGSRIFAEQRGYVKEGLDWYNWCGQCQKTTKQKIEEVSSLSKERRKVKNNVTKLIKYYDLKASDLSAKFRNWKAELDKLDTEEKIKDFQIEIQTEVQKQKDKQEKSENNGLSLFAKIAIGCGVVTIVWVLVGIAWYLAKKKQDEREPTPPFI